MYQPEDWMVTASELLIPDTSSGVILPSAWGRSPVAIDSSPMIWAIDSPRLLGLEEASVISSEAKLLPLCPPLKPSESKLFQISCSRSPCQQWHQVTVSVIVKSRQDEFSDTDRDKMSRSVLGTSYKFLNFSQTWTFKLTCTCISLFTSHSNRWEHLNSISVLISFICYLPSQMGPLIYLHFKVALIPWSHDNKLQT